MASMSGIGLPIGLSSAPKPLKKLNHSTRRMVVVRAEGGAINPEIRKTEDKVVDSVVVTELAKPLTAYCRFLRLN